MDVNTEVSDASNRPSIYPRCLLQDEIINLMWDLYQGIQSIIEKEDAVLLDKLKFDDFIDVCVKYTDKLPRFIQEDCSDFDSVDEEEAEDAQEEEK